MHACLTETPEIIAIWPFAETMWNFAFRQPLDSPMRCGPFFLPLVPSGYAPAPTLSRSKNSPLVNQMPLP